jgi:PEP-CTERM motif
MPVSKQNPSVYAGSIKERLIMQSCSSRISFVIALAGIMTTASMAKADIMISTMGPITGTISPWATPDLSPTPTFGQTFVDPADNPFLQSVTFLIGNNSGSAVPFQAYVFNWNGTDTTGSALFTSAPESAPASVFPFVPVTVNNMNVQLTPGNAYVVVYSTIGFTGPIGGALWDLASAASYPSGEFVFNNSPSFSGNWGNLNPNSNAAFTLSFTTNSATSPVPEPSSLALLATVAAVVWRVGRKRRLT